MRGDDDNVTGFLATAVDVSERMRAAEALSRMNERFQLATHSAGMGVWDWDVVADKLVWDERAYEIHGASRDVTPNLQFIMSLVHPEDAHALGARRRLAADLPVAMRRAHDALSCRG